MYILQHSLIHIHTVLRRYKQANMQALMTLILTLQLITTTASGQLTKEVPFKAKMFEYDIKYYLFFSKTLTTYSDAWNICQSHRGVLAQINNEVQNTFLAKTMAARVRERWYGGNSLIGSKSVHSFWTPYAWRPSDGYQTYNHERNGVYDVGYTNWIDKYTSIRSGGCIEVFLDETNEKDIFGFWNNVHCLSLRPFVCEVDEDEIPTVTETQYKKYLMFVQNLRSYNDASDTCKRNSGELCMIKNNEENEFVINAMKNAYMNYWISSKTRSYSIAYWIGIRVQNNTIVYDNGNQLTFKNFTQTSFQLDDDYQRGLQYTHHNHMWSQPKDYWGITNLNAKLYFVCEIAKNTNGSIIASNSTTTSSNRSHIENNVIIQNQTFNTSIHNITNVTNLTNNVTIQQGGHKLHRKITDVDVTPSDLLWAIVSVGALVLITFIVLTALVLCQHYRQHRR